MKRLLEILDGKRDTVLRLHAGENVYSRNNPLFSLRVIDELYTKYHCCRTLPSIRIGHGLHVAENDLTEFRNLLHKYHVVVEINASSNFALSNTDSLKAIPYQWYVRNGIPIVLATDGAGMYLTDAIQESIIANTFGGEETLEAVKETEERHIGR